MGDLSKTMLLVLIPGILMADSAKPKKELHYDATLDFLYWQASEQGLDYAVQVSSNPEFQPKSMHWKHPSFEWDPGFRLGFAYYLEKNQWDISLLWTHLNSESQGHASSGGLHHFLEQLWTPSPYGIDALSASAKWNLYYDTLDLLLSCPCKMNRYFEVIPAFGLRGLLIDQTFKVKYAGGDFDLDSPIKLKAENNYHALGLHLDLGLLFHLNRHLIFFGNAAGTLLYGRFNVPEKVSGENVLIQLSSGHLFRERRNFIEVTNDLAAGLGLQYRPILSNKWHLYLSFAYEIVKVFDQNQMRRYRDQNPSNPQNTDLGLQGITLSLDVKW